MLGMDAGQPLGSSMPEARFCSLAPTSEALRRVCLPAPQLQANLFGSFEESLLLGRAEALAAADLLSPGKSQQPFRPDAAYQALSAAGLPSPGCLALAPAPHAAGLDGHLLEPPPGPPTAGQGQGQGEGEAGRRALEAFAERFKQRRVKLGVTQADVGAALARLQLPGVGALSQSTICRFESLTLSPNNMRALRPVLRAWLEEAEAQAQARAQAQPAAPPHLLAAAERKRRRTSLAAPEKRSLEAYFALQPRPSAEKIAAIAHKLDLQKNVVRVWFCNQRQKQKRLKYAAAAPR